MLANSTQASHKLIRTFFTQQCANPTATFEPPSEPYAGELIEKSKVTELCRAKRLSCFSANIRHNRYRK